MVGSAVVLKISFLPVFKLAKTVVISSKVRTVGYTLQLSFQLCCMRDFLSAQSSANKSTAFFRTFKRFLKCIKQGVAMIR